MQRGHSSDATIKPFLNLPTTGKQQNMMEPSKNIKYDHFYFKLNADIINKTFKTVITVRLKYVVLTKVNTVALARKVSRGSI